MSGKTSKGHKRGLPIQERIHRFDYIKIKNFCSRDHKESAKASHGKARLSNKRLTSIIYKEMMQINMKKKTQ